MPHAVQSLSIATFPSTLGWMAAIGHGNTLRQLTFGHASPQEAIRALDAGLAASAQVDRWNPPFMATLQAYAEGKTVDFSQIDIELEEKTPFQRQILVACHRIPYGATMTYGQLAAAAGSPRAARAVGNIMAGNLIPLVIPCHRVVPSGGRLGGYSAAGGVHTKLRLLEAEGVDAARLRVAKPRQRRALASLAS